MTKSKHSLLKVKNGERKVQKKGLYVVGCRYDVILRVLMESDFIGMQEFDGWSLCWSDAPLSLEKINDMKHKQAIGGYNCPPIQKFNHFPGMYEICRKDRLCRNLNRLKRIFPKDYDFFPASWDLPSDISDLLEYGKRHKNTTYIVKPDSGCQGKGIFLVNNLKLLCPFAKCVCQVYVENPFLIDGYKFDQRIYVLITCVDPLRFYIHTEGIARFATVKYQPPSDENLDVTFMHLTNYSLNKFSDAFDSNGSNGTKRPMSEVYNCMNNLGYNVDKLKDDIDDVVVKTIVGVSPSLRHSYRATFAKRDRGCFCFEVLGLDILVDRHLKPYLIEVNHSPSFNLDTPVDSKVKFHVVRDLFSIIKFDSDPPSSGDDGSKSDKFNIQRYNRRRGTLASSISNALKDQFAHEERVPHDFRLVFSEENPGKYAQFMDKEYFLKDYEDAKFFKKRLEPRMHDGLSESFHKSCNSSPTLTSVRETLYGKVYVESRPASPYEYNHREFLRFKYNTQFTESAHPGKFFKIGRSRKNKVSIKSEKKKGLECSTDLESGSSTSRSGSADTKSQSIVVQKVSKLTPTQRVEKALEILRKSNVEKFKEVKNANNVYKYCPELITSIQQIRPVSPYLNNCAAVIQDSMKSIKMNVSRPSTPSKKSKKSCVKNDTSFLYLDTTKLPSVFQAAMEATQLQRENTRIKSADVNKKLKRNDSFTSFRNILLGNSNHFKPLEIEIMEERERLKTLTSRKPDIEIYGIGAAAQKVVEMLSATSDQRNRLLL